MFIEKKKVVTTGNSLSVTLKGNVPNALNLKKGDEVKVTYQKNRIIIQKEG